MKQFILLLVVGGTLFSCTSSIDNKGKENLAIAKRYLEAVETKNVVTMDSLLADNYMGYGPSVDDSTNKAEALANWKDNADNLYESIKYTRYQNIAVTAATPGCATCLQLHAVRKFQSFSVFGVSRRHLHEPDLSSQTLA